MATSSITDRLVIEDMEAYERLLALQDMTIEPPDLPIKEILEESQEALEDLFR